MTDPANTFLSEWGNPTNLWPNDYNIYGERNYAFSNSFPWKDCPNVTSEGFPGSCGIIHSQSGEFRSGVTYSILNIDNERNR